MGFFTLLVVFTLQKKVSGWIWQDFPYKQKHQNKTIWRIDKVKFYHIPVTRKQIYNSWKISMPHRRTEVCVENTLSPSSAESSMLVTYIKKLVKSC